MGINMFKRTKQTRQIKQILLVRVLAPNEEIAVYVNGKNLPVSDHDELCLSAKFLSSALGIALTEIKHKVEGSWNWDQVARDLVASGSMVKPDADGFFPV
jgi:hypothetical protein